VDAAKIHGLIGMDSDLLLESALGDRAAELGERATELRTDYYLAMADRLRPFDGARDLIADLYARGVAIVLATSASDEELAILKRVLDVDAYLTDDTSSGDVDTAKPKPDVVVAALQKAGTAASDAVFIGDSRWDVIAAERAGVECLAVLSGGRPLAELRDAGASAVLRDVAEVRDTLETGPLARLWN
jgi:HAD superfamily hydrolase (TIGR01509 family)